MRYSSAKATLGYGLTLMLVFVASTVMLGSSLQMMAGPISMAYMGTASQDNLAAKELAQAGMKEVIADLQTLYDSGQSITTSYTFASSSAPNSVLMPSNPDAPGTLDATVGSYTGAVEAVNGNNLLVSVTATVGSGVYLQKKIVILSHNPFSLDGVTGATAAYGMRKLRSAYAGSAIRVRRGSDNVEQDIGFDASGSLDVAALRNFLENSTTYPKPLDSVGSSVAAYSLRKLRNAYTGYAIRVRRSSDSTTQDIGFDLGGNLDVNALVDFVGTGSGYVTTWYDQSGNARDATQATAGSQPRIVNAGAIDMQNGRPAIYFASTSLATATFTGYGTAYHVQVVAKSTGSGCMLAKTNVNVPGPFDFYNASHLIGDGTPFGFAGQAGNTNFATSGLYAAWAYSGSATTLNTWMNGTSSQYAISAAYPYADAGRPLYIGSRDDAATNFSGYMAEAITYNAVLSTANRQTLENGQARYYQLTMAEPTFAKPLDAVSTTAAYGLRKMRTAYAGSAINVRRSSDNTTLDISFDANGNLQIDYLMNFCGASSCYVTTWYDQSGSNNATQATAANQPRIVNAGVLDTKNGRPTIVYSGSQWLQLASLPTAMGSDYASTLNLVAYTSTSGATVYHQGDGSGWPAGASTFYFNNGSAGTAFGKVQCNGNWSWGANGYTNGAPHVFTLTDPTGGSNQTVATDGTLLNNATASEYAASGTVARIGWTPLNDGSVQMNGGISEVTVTNTNLSTANRQTLENNQMAYYNVNSGAPGNGYVSKWYDQSGNGYDFSQSTYLLQPRITWDNTSNRATIYFNGLNNYMTTVNTLSLTGTQATAFMLASLNTTSNTFARLLVGRNNSDANDFTTNTSAIFAYSPSGTNAISGYRNSSGKSNSSFTLNKLFQATSIYDGTNHTFRMNGVANAAVASSGSFGINQLWLGTTTGFGVNNWTGNISEIILYPSNPTTAQIQLIESGERTFYATP
jgi:hypothetical protein